MAHHATDRPPVHALLADGTTVCIRSVVAGDHDQLEGLYEEMSPENLRLRFFAVSHRSAHLAADRACAPARTGYRALLAETQGQVVGLAEYDAGDSGDETDAAEVSIAVADGLHHRGVGTLLVEHLVSAARAEGIRTFTADALSENHAVLKLFADLGLRTTRRFEGPEVRCSIALDQSDSYLTAVEERGRAADVASLEPLLRPKVVAVIGAGRKPGSVGRAILHQLHAGGYTGRLFAVNPAAHAILGVPSYSSVSALPRTLTSRCSPYPPPRSRRPPRSAGRRAYAPSSSSPQASTRTRRRHCWRPAVRTACASSAPTASVSPTPTRS